MREARFGATVALVTLIAVSPACSGKQQSSMPDGAHEITIQGPAGVLDAVEMGTGDRVVVLSHGADSSKEAFFPLLPALAGVGFRAIAYDARGIGASAGKPDIGTRADDLAAVVTSVRASGATSVVLGGSSLGGAVTLSTAADLDADALILLAPAVPDASAVGQVPKVPILIAVAQDNEPFTTYARNLADALGVQPIVVSGSAHGAKMLVPHPELADQIATFVSSLKD
jgi:alpha-beta hydrolase superfamily lysophospholipase